MPDAITLFVITILLKHYYALFHISLLRIINVFVITVLLHHYHALLHISLLRIITVFAIALLLHHYYVLLHIHYYLLLRHLYYVYFSSLILVRGMRVDIFSAMSSISAFLMDL